MEILTIDNYEAEVIIGGICHDVKFNINWQNGEGEVEVTEIYRTGDNLGINLIGNVSHDTILQLEYLIEKYGDKLTWLDDHISEYDDCFDHLTRRAF